MSDLKDLELIFQSRVPIIVIQTYEELRVMNMLKKLVLKINKPLFSWTVTEGFSRVDLDLGEQIEMKEPLEVLSYIKSSHMDAVYVLLDFHPYIEEPVNARLLKEIAQQQLERGHHIVLVSHAIDIPGEFRHLVAYFELQLPDRDKLLEIVRHEAQVWSSRNKQKKVTTDNKTLDALMRNLGGLSVDDARRLARKVIVDDGAITVSDVTDVMAAKYELLNRDGLLSFEYDTEKFSDIGGMRKLKSWLQMRASVFKSKSNDHGLQNPKGILLLGVQGCGKSLVSKAVAGIFSVPLLRLDFGVLFNKFFGESEKNLRQALKTAELMAPCVLWVDEIEKGLSSGDNDGGTSRRVLGTMLTWMAENDQPVFMVATANDIESLPPELIRKGRFDEIFFVDLPNQETRAEIFKIHLQKRNMGVSEFDIDALVQASDGFSGAEIEQAIVAALYVVHAQKESLQTRHILDEIAQTRPLSILMSEKINYLRQWAGDRTVSVE